MQDEQIIALLQKRDEQALAEIRTAYGRLCFSVAEQMLGSAEDAEECVNEMLLSVWNSIPPHIPYNLKNYLVTLLRRAATDQLRRNTRLKRGIQTPTSGLSAGCANGCWKSIGNVTLTTRRRSNGRTFWTIWSTLRWEKTAF